MKTILLDLKIAMVVTLIECGRFIGILKVKLR